MITNKIRLGDSTIWKNCNVIPAATKISFEKSKGLVSRCYWDFEFTPDYRVSESDIVAEASLVFQNAVLARESFGKFPVITLTGGLDSRLMASVLSKSERSKFIATTMGIPGCDEINIASQVASALDLKHVSVALDHKSCFESINASFLENEDIDLLVQTCWDSLLYLNRNRDILMHGLDLDVTLGGIYLTEELFTLSSKEELVDYALRKSLSAPISVLSKLFKNKLEKDTCLHIKDQIKSLIDSCWDGDVANSYDKFIISTSMRRVILQRYRAIRSSIETISPMYDQNLIQLYLKIPPKIRAKHNLFRKVLIKLCPDLASLPYQRTGIPPSVPTKFWSDGEALGNQTEELYRKIAFDSNGKVFIPYKKYYTNVDEWLRNSLAWKNAINDLLLSPHSILCEYIIDQDQLRRLVREHQSHEKSHMKLLHILMSSELYLRKENGHAIGSTLSAFHPDNDYVICRTGRA